MKNLHFRIPIRPCFIHICKTLTSNPELLNFPPPCQRFLPIQRTLFLSLFLSFIKQWWRSWEEWGGSNVKGYESKFSQNSHQYIPAQSLCFLTHYTATKNSFTLLEIATSQEKIYGPSVHSAFGWRRCPQRDNPIPCQKTQPFRQIFETERGEGEEKRGGGVPKPLLANGGTPRFCWLEFAKNFEKFLRNLTALF